MARKLKLEVGALNIRLHPHDADRYRSLFRTIFSMKRKVSLRGDRSALITSLRRIGREDRYVFGVITSFLEFDGEGRWLNTDTLEEASSNELQEVRIPANLRPNSRPHMFRFDVDRHELAFEHYGNGNRLAHNLVLAFFRVLFDDPRIEAEFGDVKVTIVQSAGSVDRLFAIPRVTELEIYIERPNADLWGDDFEEQAEEHLEDKNARSMTVTYKAEAGEGITRDEDLDALLRASIKNGRAIARGYGNDGHEVVTTDRFPKIVQGKYDEDELSQNQMFEVLANELRRRA